MGHWYGKNRMGKPGVSRGGGVCRHWHVIYRFDRQIVGRSVDLSFGLPLSLSLCMLLGQSGQPAYALLSYLEENTCKSCPGHVYSSY